MDLKINNSVAAGKKKNTERLKKEGNTRIKQGRKLQARIQKGRKTLFRQYTCKYEKGTKGEKRPGINPSGPLDHPQLLLLRCKASSLNRSMQALPSGP